MDTLLKYKIRFENDVNATAPAQRVVVDSVLDDDLDLRSLEFCSFGFGNHSFENERCTSIVQVGSTLTLFVGSLLLS